MLLSDDALRQRLLAEVDPGSVNRAQAETATGTDLDALAANYGIAREVPDEVVAEPVAETPAEPPAPVPPAEPAPEPAAAPAPEPAAAPAQPPDASAGAVIEPGSDEERAKAEAAEFAAAVDHTIATLPPEVRAAFDKLHPSREEFEALLQSLVAAHAAIDAITRDFAVIKMKVHGLAT